MRDDSLIYIAKNAASRRIPRHVVTIDLDGDGSNIYYLTSHDDIVTPDSAKTIHNVVTGMPVESQTLNPIEARSEIGYSSISLSDVIDEFTDLLNSEFFDAVAENSIRMRTVEFYTGFEGMEFSDYALIGTQQIYGKIVVDINNYTIDTQDLQRAMRSDLFEREETTLTKNLTKTQTYVHVALPDNFETLKHDANFSDRPDGGPSVSTVGYFKVEDAKEPEKILWEDKEVNTIQVSGTDISFASGDSSINSTSTSLLGDGTNTYEVGMGIEIQNSPANSGLFTIASVAANKITVEESITTESAGASIILLVEPQFYNCERGALGSRAISHETDLTASVDRRTKVSEHIYIETNILKVIYGVLTGVWYGTSDAWPTKWNLGISTSLVESSEFINHFDLWNTSDDSGLPVYIEGEKQIDGKQFIETQLNFSAGGYIRVLNNGKLGFRRFTRVLSSASTVATFDESNLVAHSAISYALDDLVNIMNVLWNYEDRYEKTTRKTPLVDLDSISKHRIGDVKTFTLRSLHGSIHTVPLIYSIFDMVRDRYAGYPITMTVVGMPELNRYEIGDVVRVKLDNVRDHTNETTKRLDRAFEIQQKSYDPLTGEPTFTLFGSTEPATLLAEYEDATVLSDSYYGARGRDIKSYTTGTSSGGTYTITSNATLTGTTDLSAVGAGGVGIYYCDENLTIAGGVVVTCTDNVQFDVKGLITGAGRITTVGQGLAGGTGNDTSGFYPIGNQGTPGYIGTVESVGGIVYPFFPLAITRGPVTQGEYNTAPYLVLTNNGTSLDGIPPDLRGSSGGAGNPLLSITTVLTNGGNGATGPGALVFVCRGFTFTGDGDIDVSGSVGSDGTLNSTVNPDGYSGAGAPSHPSAVYVLLDGADSLYPENRVIADLPGTTIQGNPITDIGVFGNVLSLPPAPISSYYRGTQYVDMSQNVFRVQYIPRSVNPEPDVPPVADTPTGITVTEATAVNTINAVILNIGATAPSDGNYRGAEIRISLQGEDTWTVLGEVRETYKIPVYVPTDGSTWEIRAYPIAKSTGKVSEEYYSTTHTVVSTGVLIEGTIDPDVVQNNTNALNSDCIFDNTTSSNLIWEESTTGSYTITKKSYGLQLFDGSTSESGVYAISYITRFYDITPFSWDKGRYLEGGVRVSRTGEGRTSLVTGWYYPGLPNKEHMGFELNASGNIVATYSNGTSTWTQTLQTYAVDTLYILKVVYTYQNTIEWYVDDVLKHTVDYATYPTRFPSGTLYAPYTLVFSSFKDTGSLDYLSILGEVKFFQAP